MRRLLLLGLIALSGCSDSTGETQRDAARVLDLQTESFKGCALIEGGELWCWGVVVPVSSIDRPALTPVRVPIPGKVISFAIGSGQLCAATDEGATYCAGYWFDYDTGDSYGTGLVLLQDTLPLHGLSASANVVCGVTGDQHLACWGSKMWGTRGEGFPDTTASNAILNLVAGDDSYLAVEGGSGSSCGIRTDRTMTCWGLVSHLGTTPPAALVSKTCYYKRLDCVWTPVLLPLSNIEQISGNCLRAGVIRCWGPDVFGESLPVPTDIGLPESPIDLDGSCALGVSGKAYCWGWPDPRLGHHATDTKPHAVETDLRFERIAARGAATCGVTETQAVYCWGTGAYGSIGDGDTTSTYTPRRVTEAWASH